VAIQKEATSTVHTLMQNSSKLIEQHLSARQAAQAQSLWIALGRVATLYYLTIVSP
jgi:hypothetical protein